MRAQTLGTILDPSLVHRLEPLSLLLGIMVWDGADGVAALALAVGGLHHHLRVLMTILSTSISVSARLSSDDRSRRAHVDARRQSRAPCRWRPFPPAPPTPPHTAARPPVAPPASPAPSAVLKTTKEPTDHAASRPGSTKCQAPTGTTVAQEPELRPKLSSSYRNPMVKHEPELHT